MLTLTQRSPSAAALAAHARSIPARVIPYAAASALTRVARLAQQEIVQEMGRVFDRPTRCTLNATRVVPATAKQLQARVAVKDTAGSAGVTPQTCLEPQVVGGLRGEKRFERALRSARPASSRSRPASRTSSTGR